MDDEIQTAETVIKKQEEFENMKKKTKRIVLGLVAVIVAAIAGITAYKYTH